MSFNLPSSSSFFSFPRRTLFALLHFCQSLRSLRQVHALLVRTGFDQDGLLINKFLCLCTSLSDPLYASSVFDSVSHPNTYLWNSLLKSLSSNAPLPATVSAFNRMRLSPTPPDPFTFPSLLKASSQPSRFRIGLSVHCAALALGLDSNLFVATALVDFYGKCRHVCDARKVFDEMPSRNEVTWTAMIMGHVSLGELAGARELFDQMPDKNAVTWNAMICACVRCGDLRAGRKLFDEMPERNLVSFTTMIDGYAKAGDMASARFLFDRAVGRDPVLWSAMVSGYAQNGRPDEAVSIFFEMYRRNIVPDEFVVVGLMSACAQVGDLNLARWVDSFVASSRIEHNRPHVVAALIDMNAKCGNMERAMHLFEKMPKRDLFSYCSVIQGQALSGSGDKAIGLFRRMQDEGLKPDAVAFTVVLAACSHAGLVEEGFQIFTSMEKEYGINPSSDHYACMVDILGRAGRLKEAYGLIKSMPMEPHAGAWGALLGACRLHNNIGLAEIIANHLFEVEPNSAGNYVLLSNIYADVDRWSDVENVRERMRQTGVRKVPGCSWCSAPFLLMERSFRAGYR